MIGIGDPADKDVFWRNAPPGRHALRMVEGHGRSDTRTVVVELDP